MNVKVFDCINIALTWGWRCLARMLRAVDRKLVWIATPFGVNVKNTKKRYAILLGIYGAIYLLAQLAVPILALVALCIGYIGVLAVGRAWVLNEKQRNAIAKKLADGNPDELPDLRLTALVSALQLLILFPFIFQHIQSLFGLYSVPTGTNLWKWFLFTVDSYNKAFLGLLEVYGIRPPSITYESAWGRHLVTLSRLTFDYLLVQGIFRLLAIREMIHDAVEAGVRGDIDMAIRVGKRAVRTLLDKLVSGTDEVRSNAAVALGRIGSSRAVFPLIRALDDQAPQVRRFAAFALGELKDTRSVEPLFTLLRDQDEDTRGEVAGALGVLGDKRAVELLIPLLQDQSPLVRDKTTDALGQLADVRAVDPLIQRLRDEDGMVRGSAVRALARLGDLRAVQPLLQVALEDENEFIRSDAAKAAAHLDPVAAEKAGVA